MCKFLEDDLNVFQMLQIQENVKTVVSDRDSVQLLYEQVQFFYFEWSPTLRLN